jgi:hypothetical protein
MDIIEKKNIFLSSKERTSGDINNCTFQFNNNNKFFQCNPNQKIFATVQTFQILNDFYNIDNTNNKFIIRFIDTNGTNDILIQLNNGYYDVYNLILELENTIKMKLESEFPSVIFNVNITYLDSENKYNFTITTTTSGFFAPYSVFFVFDNDSIHQYLGFVIGEWSLTLTNAETASIKSNYVLNFVKTQTIYIKSNIVSKNEEINNNKLTTSQHFFNVNIDVPKFSMINFFNSNKMFQSEVLNNISNIEIKLLDENNKLINFFTDFNISIEFEKHTYKNDVVPLLKQLKDAQEAELIMRNFRYMIEKEVQQSTTISDNELGLIEDSNNEILDLMTQINEKEEYISSKL